MVLTLQQSGTSISHLCQDQMFLNLQLCGPNLQNLDVELEGAQKIWHGLCFVIIEVHEFSSPISHIGHGFPVPACVSPSS